MCLRILQQVKQQFVTCVDMPVHGRNSRGVTGVATPPYYEVRGLLMDSNPPELEEI